MGRSENPTMTVAENRKSFPVDRYGSNVQDDHNTNKPTGIITLATDKIRVTLYSVFVSVESDLEKQFLQTRSMKKNNEKLDESRFLRIIDKMFEIHWTLMINSPLIICVTPMYESIKARTFSGGI